MCIEPILGMKTYEREREKCDAAKEYADLLMAGKRNYLTREEALAPVYAACDNDMRGRVEQFEILRDLPEVIYAYIGTLAKGGAYPVTVWTGLPLGYATLGSSWRVNSYVGTRMHQFYARIGGREYTGRGLGEGCSIRLRETAESRRDRESA